MQFPSPAPAESAQAPSHSEESSEGAEEEHRHLHHLGAFLGGTSSPHGSGFTLGAEYEFRFHPRFGVGAIGEAVAGSLQENVFVALAYFHPTESLGFFAGGGWDRRLGIREEEAVHATSGQEGDESSGKRKPLGRIGVLYDIPLGNRAAFSPNISLDFVDGTTALVYGVTVGIRF